MFNTHAGVAYMIQYEKNYRQLVKGGTDIYSLVNVSVEVFSYFSRLYTRPSIGALCSTRG